jgi:hypothetical protein
LPYTLLREGGRKEGREGGREGKRDTERKGGSECARMRVR